MNIKNKLFFFWNIGKNICFNRERYENIILKYSEFYSYKYGTSSTFTRENIHYMKRFYCKFPIFINVFTKLEWEHYVLLLRISDARELYFYFRVAIFCRSSVSDLNHIINNNFYNRI